jgi:hypothetical protein
MLTKNFYKKRQLMALVFCTICAAIVGSLQTTWITKEIRSINTTDIKIKTTRKKKQPKLPKLPKLQKQPKKADE